MPRRVSATPSRIHEVTFVLPWAIDVALMSRVTKNRPANGGLRLVGSVASNRASSPPVRSCQAKAKEGWARPGRTKNEHRLRTLPVHTTAVQALRLWLDQGYELWAGRKPEVGMPLFPGLDGDYSRTDAAVHIRQDLRAAGLPDKVDGRNVDFHATRRSCATWLEELGANDVHRKRLMGHAIKDVTDKNYTRKTRELMVQLRGTVELIPLRWSSTLVRVFGAAAPSEANSSTNSAPQRRPK